MVKKTDLKLLSNIKGDLSGALTAAIITLPMSIGYGLLAFAPLGLEFAPKAALIGIYAAVFSGFFAAMLGGTPIQITGPKAPLTLVLGAVIVSLVANLNVQAPGPSAPIIILGLASLCVFIAGLSQVLLGALGFGNLLKYVPRPVVSGFMNGIAFLLIVKQIKPLFGLNSNIQYYEILTQLHMVQPLTLMVGILTIVTIFIAKRFTQPVPSSLVGLSVGSALYYFLKAIFDPAALGQVIGKIGFEWPKPDIFLQLFHRLESFDVSLVLADLFVAGLVLGLLGSMESLLSAVVSDNLTGTRHNGTRELVGQGIGNIICALFGTLPCAGSIPRSMANFKAGGRTRLSGIMCGVLLFLMVTILRPFVGKIPIAVIAGIVFVVGVNLFDKWTLSLLTKITGTSEHRKEYLIDLLVTLTVAFLTVSINLIVAVGIGILIALALFISRMGKSIIKREYFGDRFHSRKMRSFEQTAILEEKGRQICILEIQGPLFFGSAEILAKRIESLMPELSYCIIDMKRLNEIDSTGANIIGQIKRRIEKDDKHLLLSHVNKDFYKWDFLESMGSTGQLDDKFIFPDADAALEWAEDHLLGQLQFLEEHPRPVDLSHMDLLRDFNRDELESIKQNLVHQTFREGEVVFAEGDQSRNLYFLTRGAMSVQIYLPENNSHKRLYSYTPGVIFGEMAFLDGSTRSAGVWANEDSEVFVLSLKNFQNLQKEKPEIANKLIVNIALELSRRLRRTSDQVRLLEDS